MRPDGTVPRVHADGIALDLAGEYLYYQALTGRTLYRIETRWLRDAGLTEQEQAAKVESLGQTGAADGLFFGPDNRIYISSLEENAIKAVTPGGKPVIVVQSPEMAWPDSFAISPDGSIYVTTSQIHRGPKPPEPYKIFKLEKYFQ
jgi:sugar lactone lactonase YvrE